MLRQELPVDLTGSSGWPGCHHYKVVYKYKRIEGGRLNDTVGNRKSGMPMKPEQHGSNVHKYLLPLSSVTKLNRPTSQKTLILTLPTIRITNSLFFWNPRLISNNTETHNFTPYKSPEYRTHLHIPHLYHLFLRISMGLSSFVLHNQDFQEFTISCMSGSHPTNFIYFYSITPPTNTVLQ